MLSHKDEMRESIPYFDEFIELEEHATHMLRSAQNPKEAAYWQGVKDGMRKLYALFSQNDERSGIGGSSPHWRPDVNMREYDVRPLMKE